MPSNLLQQQQDAGGVLVVRGATMPPAYQFCRPEVLHFGDAPSEYCAATSGAAVFDVSDRGQIEIAGKDCRPFLHNFCTNDIKRLQPGQGCEAFVANVKGRILAHVFVFATDASLWLEIGSADEASLVAHFERYVINQDVELLGVTARYGQLLVSGPQSESLLAGALGELRPLAPWEHLLCEHAGQRLAVRRVDMLGTSAYLLSSDRTLLADLWSDLIRRGGTPCGAEAFHALRIEAGLPLYGLDMDSDNLAQEASRTDRAISFTKGCYLGQEPIARIDSVGHINRQLCRLHIQTDAVPSLGAPVVAEGGAEIGTLKSAARIPGQSICTALALLRATHSQPGRPVTVIVDSQHLPAELR